MSLGASHHCLTWLELNLQPVADVGRPAPKGENLKYKIEVSSFEVSVIRKALAMYAESTAQKAKPRRGLGAATNSIQVAVAISELDKRLTQLQDSSSVDKAATSAVREK